MAVDFLSDSASRKTKAELAAGTGVACYKIPHMFGDGNAFDVAADL
jgi:hypothetical protein